MMVRSHSVFLSHAGRIHVHALCNNQASLDQFINICVCLRTQKDVDVERKITVALSFEAWSDAQ